MTIENVTSVGLAARNTTVLFCTLFYVPLAFAECQGLVGGLSRLTAAGVPMEGAGQGFLSQSRGTVHNLRARYVHRKEWLRARTYYKRGAHTAFKRSGHNVYICRQ